MAWKILLALLVILHHAAHAYATGENWPIREEITTSSFTPFLGVNAAYFMGAFFFISGILVPRTLTKQGIARFLQSRARRLLIPAFILALVSKPFLMIVLEQHFSLSELLSSYVDHFDVIHGWFLVQLFFYSALYALFKPFITSIRLSFNRIHTLALLALSLGSVTALVATTHSINDWVFFRTIEPYHTPQYALMFFLGTLYAQGNEHLKPATTVVNCVATLLLIALYVGNSYYHFYSYTLEHFWASALAICCTLGMLGVFDAVTLKPSPWLDRMARATFGAYLIHNFVVVLANKALLAAPFSPMTKFGFVGVFSVVVSFGCVMGVHAWRATTPKTKISKEISCKVK
jgi:glucan biosynthesis protein C